MEKTAIPENISPAESAVVSIRDFAKIVNCSHTQIWRLTQSGIIPQTGGGIPIPEAIDAFVEYQQSKKRGRAKISGIDDYSLEMREAEYRLMQAKAKLSELEYKRRAGILVEAAAVRATAAATAAELKEKLFALPARVAGIMENKTAAEAEKLLTDEIVKVLQVMTRGIVALNKL